MPYSFYTRFPKNWVFQRVQDPEDNDEGFASPETYVSFIGEDKGWVYESIERGINEVLGNYSEMALPACSQVFDGTATEPESLEFEYRLFDLITELCNILYGLL